MKKILASAVTLVTALIFSSCMDNYTGNFESIPTATDTWVTNAPMKQVPVAKFKAFVIKHSVADFAKWKTAYIAHESVRKSHGLTDLELLTGTDNPNEVLVVEKMTDIKKAKQFTTLPDLKETMQNAGVNSTPEFAYYDVIRYNDAPVDSRDRVVITHRVKDFDKWVKAFNAESKEVRRNEGMLDRVLARGIDDPNVVHIVFVVTDMQKAKTAIFSESKKKIMTDAGVEGVPTIEFFTIVK